jgi:hypothetical protein
MHPAILNKKYKKKKEDGDKRLPLRLPLKPEPYGIENHKKKKKKSSNDYVINVNDEFIVDFDINEDKGNVIREETWNIVIEYRL